MSSLPPPQALMHFYRFPDFWLGYAKFCESQNSVDERKACLERSITALPSSVLLRFALADCYEEMGLNDEANNTYRGALQEPSIGERDRSGRTGDGVEAKQWRKSS